MPLFRFVKQAASLAQKRCAASPTVVVSDSAGNGVADWKHLTLHLLRIHMDATYREIVDWASEMDRVRGLLQFAPSVSDPLRSRRAWGDGCHFFDREAASSHYRDRSDRHIRTLKTTALVDIESWAVLDLHCSAHQPHDTQVGRRVAMRNTDEIESLAGDKGYDDQSLRDALRSKGVRPVIRHRVFALYDHVHNARLDSDLYGQRWMAESAFSGIKRRFGSAVGSIAWYREFRELVLTVAVYNLEQAIKE